jgi:ABC-type lipoprotein release transport system permease subunit
MRNDLFLIKKYWFYNKNHLIKALLSVIILVAMLMVAVSIERTELRREYDRLLHAYGAYNFAYADVREEVYNEISNLPEVEEMGRIMVCGKLGNSSKQFTYGAYTDETAEKLDYLELKWGHLPRNNGEVAIYDYALKELYFDTDDEHLLGTEIQLNQYDLNGKYIGKKSLKIVGIIKKSSFRQLIESNQSLEMSSNFAMPMLFLNYDECMSVLDFHSYALIKCIKSEYEDLESNELRLLFTKKFAEDYNLYIKDRGGLSIAANAIMSYQAGNKMYDGIYQTDTMTIIRYFSVIAVAISAISLFGILYSIMQKRVESLRLIKILGYSNLRIISLMVFEWIILFVLGYGIGILIGIGIYEAIIAAQGAFWGLPALKAYNPEWPIKQVTQNPYLVAFVYSFITFLLGYAIYFIRFAASNRISVLKHKKIRSFMRIKRILSGDKFTNIMQVAALSLVLFTTTAFYSYYTLEGKGESRFTDPKLVGDAYYEYAGINMKKSNIDSCIYTVRSPAVNFPMTRNIDSGIPPQALDIISSIPGVSNIHAYKAIYGTSVVYSKDWEGVPDFFKNLLKRNPKLVFNKDMDEFYNDHNIQYYPLPTVMCNDIAFENLSEHLIEGQIGKYNNGVTLVVYEEEGINIPYNIGDKVPMAYIIATKDTMNIQSKHEYEVIVDSIAVIPPSVAEEDEILNHIFRSQGVTMAMTTHTNLDMHMDNFDYTYIQFDKGSNAGDITSQIRRLLEPSMHVMLQTLEDCDKDFLQSQIERYLSIIFIFILLIIMTIVGYFSLISMKIQNSKGNIAIARALGLTKARSIKMFLVNNVVNTFISCILGTGLIYSMRQLLINKHNEATALYEKYGFLGSDYDKYAMITKLENQYLLKYEMHSAPIVKVIILVSAVLIILTIAATLLTAGKECAFNISEELSKNSKE